MAKNPQIDRKSKMLVILTAREIRAAKRQHKRFKRRQSKDIENPNPQYNRYNGYIG